MCLLEPPFALGVPAHLVALGVLRLLSIQILFGHLRGSRGRANPQSGWAAHCVPRGKSARSPESGIHGCTHPLWTYPVWFFILSQSQQVPHHFQVKCDSNLIKVWRSKLSTAKHEAPPGNRHAAAWALLGTRLLHPLFKESICLAGKISLLMGR